jgi:hypothetical protein
MSFGKMVELLQRKDKGKIILVNSGSFYIARGKDAVLLHNILNKSELHGSRNMQNRISSKFTR